jgi:tetratricopeptide (TPR) repeat protein
MKKHKEAIKVWDKAISINNKKANVNYNKGIALKHLNRNEESLQCFKLAKKSQITFGQPESS